MSSPALSDISQNNTEALKKQWQEMQQRYEEEQWLLAQLEEAAKSHWAERTAQKAKREVKEAERQRVAEEEERKRRTMKYLQWLWDKVLEEEVGKEESRDNMEGSKDGPRESQEEGTPLSTSC